MDYDELGNQFLVAQKSETLNDSFIESQFSYKPSIWMFCRKICF